ncbi:hypothetical protein ACFSRY_19750 [Pontibacter locisalis]|uniref:Uncharacterized protein n=1 Tax=Pontibacter locisalis TaxID=1719035 RepID=A0ABW5ITT4_9BACT
MKTLTKKQQRKNKQLQQRQTSKNKPVQPEGKASAAPAVELEEAPGELSGYESCYRQLTEEAETVERHARELRQTPGLEHLTDKEAQAQVDFMLRFSAWVFNQHLAEQQAASTMADEESLDEIMPEPPKVSKVPKPKYQSNKKVTESLSR